MKIAEPPASPETPPSGGGKNRIAVGIEIGTSKVCVAVGERKPDGTLLILGIGQTASRGVRKGEIVDSSMAAKSLREALADAEEKSDVSIESVRLAITGPHISSFNHRGGIDIPDVPAEITESHCRLVRKKAGEVSIPARNVFLHTIPGRYCIEGAQGVLNPLGLIGRRLDAEFHIIHGISARFRPAIRCVRELGIEVEDLVFSPIASAAAVLSQTRKNEGALVIDIGAGTTGYILYSDGEIRQSGALATGGDYITSDIAFCFRIPLAQAEKLKIGEGSALLGKYLPGETIGAGDPVSAREIDRETLNATIHMRMRDTLELLKGRLTMEPFLKSLGAGIFLTGGTSLLNGIGPLAEEIFEVPVNLTHGQTAAARAFTDPRLSTTIGLL